LAVDVHSAGAAYAFSTRSSEGECWVNFVLDFDQGVEDLQRVNEMKDADFRGKTNIP
jgi:hypothetical protein